MYKFETCARLGAGGLGSSVGIICVGNLILASVSYAVDPPTPIPLPTIEPSTKLTFKAKREANHKKALEKHARDVARVVKDYAETVANTELKNAHFDDATEMHLRMMEEKKTFDTDLALLRSRSHEQLEEDKAYQENLVSTLKRQSAEIAQADLVRNKDIASLEAAQQDAKDKYTEAEEAPSVSSGEGTGLARMERAGKLQEARARFVGKKDDLAKLRKYQREEQAKKAKLDRQLKEANRSLEGLKDILSQEGSHEAKIAELEFESKLREAVAEKAWEKVRADQDQYKQKLRALRAIAKEHENALKSIADQGKELRGTTALLKAKQAEVEKLLKSADTASEAELEKLVPQHGTLEKQIRVFQDKITNLELKLGLERDREIALRSQFVLELPKVQDGARAIGLSVPMLTLKDLPDEGPLVAPVALRQTGNGRASGAGSSRSLPDLDLPNSRNIGGDSARDESAPKMESKRKVASSDDKGQRGAAPPERPANRTRTEETTASSDSSEREPGRSESPKGFSADKLAALRKIERDFGRYKDVKPDSKTFGRKVLYAAAHNALVAHGLLQREGKGKLKPDEASKMFKSAKASADSAISIIKYFEAEADAELMKVATEHARKQADELSVMTNKLLPNSGAVGVGQSNLASTHSRTLAQSPSSQSASDGTLSRPGTGDSTLGRALQGKSSLLPEGTNQILNSDSPRSSDLGRTTPLDRRASPDVETPRGKTLTSDEGKGLGAEQDARGRRSSRSDRSGADAEQPQETKVLPYKEILSLYAKRKSDPHAAKILAAHDEAATRKKFLTVRDIVRLNNYKGNLKHVADSALRSHDKAIFAYSLGEDHKKENYLIALEKAKKRIGQSDAGFFRIDEQDKTPGDDAGHRPASAPAGRSPIRARALALPRSRSLNDLTPQRPRSGSTSFGSASGAASPRGFDSGYDADTEETPRSDRTEQGSPRLDSAKLHSSPREDSQGQGRGVEAVENKADDLQALPLTENEIRELRQKIGNRSDGGQSVSNNAEIRAASAAIKAHDRADALIKANSQDSKTIDRLVTAARKAYEVGRPDYIKKHSQAQALIAAAIVDQILKEQAELADVAASSSSGGIRFFENGWEVNTELTSPTAASMAETPVRRPAQGLPPPGQARGRGRPQLAPIYLNGQRLRPMVPMVRGSPRPMVPLVGLARDSLAIGRAVDSDGLSQEEIKADMQVNEALSLEITTLYDQVFPSSSNPTRMDKPLGLDAGVESKRPTAKPAATSNTAR